jgi:hypothetical protein
MIKIMRFVEKVSGTMLAACAIGSGNVLICILVYFEYFAPR